MDGRRRDGRHKPQIDGFLCQEAHRPVVMPLGREAARHRNQVSRLETREGTAPVLLHFIVQNGLESPLGEAPSHVGHRRLTHIQGFRKGCCTPALG